MLSLDLVTGVLIADCLLSIVDGRLSIAN